MTKATENTNQIFDIINFINNDCAVFPQEYVDKALNILVGRIHESVIYMYVDYKQLMRLGKKNKFFYAIQINSELFAIPNFWKDGQMYAVNFMNEKGDIDYQFVNSLHRDLNNILKIYDIPVEFKGIKKIQNGKLESIPNFYCNIKHKKINPKNIMKLIERLINHDMSEMPDEEVEKLIDQMEYIDLETLYSMTFMEYSNFVKERLGYGLLDVPF